MVKLKDGFYFCHTFDLGTRLGPFKDWIKKEFYPNAPKIIRYLRINLDDSEIFVNQMGLVVAFQELKSASNYNEALEYYNTKYDEYFDSISTELCNYFGLRPICDSSFMVEYGSKKLSIKWRITKIPNTEFSLTTLIEALFIDELCRVLERKSDVFLKKTSLAEDRLVAEYAQSLFPVAYPSGFLVGNSEINQMEIYFKNWKLGERVASLHQRFTESVLNTALYNGHLEKNRQNILNMLIAAIAFISLAQVSEPISIFLKLLNLSAAPALLNNIFIGLALILLFYGVWRYLLKPWISILYDNIKRRFLTGRIKDNFT